MCCVSPVWSTGRFVAVLCKRFSLYIGIYQVRHFSEAARLIHRRKTAVNSLQLLQSLPNSVYVTHDSFPLSREKTVTGVSTTRAVVVTWYNSLWLWRWLPHRLSKCHSLSATVLFKTIPSRGQYELCLIAIPIEGGEGGLRSISDGDDRQIFWVWNFQF